MRVTVPSTDVASSARTTAALDEGGVPGGIPPRPGGEEGSHPVPASPPPPPPPEAVPFR
jgi:hypothetical protein